MLEALVKQGYRPTQAYLFGSVAKGAQHAHSDIDLAVWDSRFTGCLTVDYEPVKHILSQFPLIELHTFSPNDDENTNLWAAEIKRHGVQLDLSGIHRHPIMEAQTG